MRFLALLLLVAASNDFAFAASFDKQTVTKDFVAEGCAVADFNHDGTPDVAAGRYLWLGPDFKQKVAYTPERNNPTGPSKTPYTPETGYSDYFVQFAYDFNADGWPDILVYGLPGDPAYVFENPQGKAGDWTRHNIFDVADGESPDLVDINGDGKPELLCHSSDLVKPAKAKGGKSGGQFGYVEIDWKNPFAKARFRPITPSRRPTTRKSSSTPMAMAPATSTGTVASTSSRRTDGMNSRPTPPRIRTGNSIPRPSAWAAHRCTSLTSTPTDATT